MSWEDLLTDQSETLLNLPWLGGREVFSGGRCLKIRGRLPSSPGWYRFRVEGRTARLVGTTDADFDWFEGRPVLFGFLTDGRVFLDSARSTQDPDLADQQGRAVALLSPGLERFSRISVVEEQDQLVFRSLEFPLGPEGEVLHAFEHGAEDTSSVRGVPPALDMAFIWSRLLQAEIERLQRERTAEETERVRREAAENLVRSFVASNTARSRRDLAAVDFVRAASLALSMSGARFLSERDTFQRGHKVVRFDYRGRTFECECEALTLRIVDAGICLSQGNVRGDTRFTLESLPSVIGEAMDTRNLHVTRRLDYDDDD